MTQIRESRTGVHLRDGETVFHTKERYGLVKARYDEALRCRNTGTGSTTVEFTFNGHKQAVDVDYIARLEEM